MKKKSRNYEIEHFEGVTPRVVRDLLIKNPQTDEDDIFNMRLILRASELGIDITDRSRPNPTRKKLPPTKTITRICRDISGIINYSGILKILKSDIHKLYNAGWLNISEDLPIRVMGKTKDECERRAFLIIFYWKNINYRNINEGKRITGEITKIFSYQTYDGKVDDLTSNELNKSRDHITDEHEEELFNILKK